MHTGEPSATSQVVRILVCVPIHLATVLANAIAFTQMQTPMPSSSTTEGGCAGNSTLNGTNISLALNATAGCVNGTASNDDAAAAAAAAAAEAAYLTRLPSAQGLNMYIYVTIAVLLSYQLSPLTLRQST